ncbi:Mog1p/PsbP-like protein [Amylostereum chailletii]|nr:Mog1p/PsbP-like protein [Amylostereum chailletii]
MSTIQRGFFGGAITALLPSTLIDASELRQVPDTQEVFLSPTSDISIILEILESVEPRDFSDVAKFHFDSLAHDNDAESSTVDDISIILNDRGNNTPSPVVLQGRQQVRKFNRPTANNVRIFLALYRVEAKGADLVLTMNVPATRVDADVQEEELRLAKEVFDTAVRSLVIVDLSLFA